MSDRLRRILTAHPPPRILVVGDLILDEYLRGQVDRLSPEAPVPILQPTGDVIALGGGANVAHNLVALGCDVVLAGAVGDDEAGERLRALLTTAGVDHSAVVTAGDRPTSHKTRVVAHGQQILRIDREVTRRLDATATAALEERVQSAFEGEIDGVVMSDYGKGVITPVMAASVITAGRRRGVVVTADPKGSDFSRYRGVRVLTPNLRELGIAAGVELEDPGDPEVVRAAARMLAVTDAAGLLVTCGKEGMVLCERDREPVRIPAVAREVYDITGAGDTVIAALSLALFTGADLETAARFANVAAGLVVGKPGTATVGHRELAAELADGTPTRPEKVIDREALVPVLTAARRAGERIVCTNGCFEILHAGHVAYLSAARAFGDLLVVGINSDESVRRLKGPARPLVPARERAAVVAALACVDYVTLFAEDTPQRLLEIVQPDVLVKGADYARENVVGRDLVEGRGGRVELVPLLEGVSTSKIIEAVRKRYGVA